MGRRRTVTGVTVLLTGAMLALAGNEIARADVSSSPFPPAVSAVAPVPEGAPLPAGAPAPPQDAAGSPLPAESDGATEEGSPADGSEADPVGGGEGRSAASAPAAPAASAGSADRADSASAVGPGTTVGPGSPADPESPAGPAAQAGPTTPADDRASKIAPVAKPAATTAAQRYGWGTPLPGSDEFDYTGRPDPAKWNVAGECWAGHAGNGGRCASRSTVDGSKLVQTGLANGNSAWVASKVSQRYGRWEARVRSMPTGKDNGRQYHPLLIIWPSSNRWPQDGEYDFLENGAPGQDCAESFIHYPHSPGAVQQVFTKESDCGAPLTQWHNVAFEWTPDHVRGYIDGKQWFDLSGGANGIRKKIQDMPAGHLTIQLDNFFGSNMQPATYEVDWVRIYALR